ncbi:MAG TPA: MucB/RseB C-terminal domain-containing protein [Cellvibrio sp.]|nr:MucB/RseB C-terminal domain-containing protein [Cellvibrio sp.]
MAKVSLWLWLSLILALTTNTQAQESPSSASSSASPSVQTLLNKMSQKAATLNYRGTFTYQNQSSVTLQSFKVEHWIEEGIKHDRLLFLNGPEREIVREGQALDCRAMGDKLLQGGFADIAKTLVALDDLYQFEVRSQERVAGRLARVLQVIPQDPYRYGYFLSIDEETGIVLKAWLIDENANPLERYQFVSIEIDPVMDSHEKTRVSHYQHKAVADVTPCNPTELGTPDSWNVAWVPQGFAFAGQRKLANGQDMLMYTDGLTTFSIFLEPAKGNTPEGVGQRGATLAYMSHLMIKNSLYRINVVGEIPVAAAAKIAQNIAGR